MSPSPTTTPPCGRPVASRGYATLVAALAAFLLSMVVLRVPFRGYLIEARLAGRLSDGLNASAVEAWLKAAAPGVTIRVRAQPGGGCQVVMQQIAPRADDTRFAIDRVARQFAEQYVVHRHETARQVKLARLQAELRAARDMEDDVRLLVEELRAVQLAQSRITQTQPIAAPETLPPPGTSQATSPTVAAVSPLERLRQRRESLLFELAGLLGNFTEQHPKVVLLRSEIAGIERELAAASESLAEQPIREKQAAHRMRAHHVGLTGKYCDGDVSAAGLDEALANLAAATRARQWAERQLQTELETLSSSGGYPWSLEAARIVTRVGGTPRILTLLAAGLAALVASALMFWLSAALNPPAVIQTTDDLADLLALPLVGTAEVTGRSTVRRWQARPWLARASLHGCELVLAGMFLALGFTMISDGWLAGQVLSDPFGVLSEVSGRLLG
jgi:hypothetical protein